MLSPVDIKKETLFNAHATREDFPILSRPIYADAQGKNGKPLIYFDNAATTQKPRVVIDALINYYTEYNANIHRGVHYLSQKASVAYDDVRVKVQKFIRAESENEIVFVRGTTEAINLVATSYGRKYISEGDEIIISSMEHHSNIVPWQLLCEEKKATLKIIPINNEGEIILAEFEKLLSPKTKFVSITHTSNSLGTINPVKEMIRIVRNYSASRMESSGIKSYVPVLIDGAQAVAHSLIDVQDMDCDFFAFSGHKMFGPTGIGCLYGKLNLLEKMPPYQGGGEMIHSVSFENTTFNEVPYKFEAGTPNVADVIALGAAIDYLQVFDRKTISDYERELMRYATQQLKTIDGIRIIGTAGEKSSIVSFIIDQVNALDAGMYLDTLGVAVRTGHHCTEPVMKQFRIPGTIRASFVFYNTKDEIDVMIDGIRKAITLLKK